MTVPLPPAINQLLPAASATASGSNDCCTFTDFLHLLSENKSLLKRLVREGRLRYKASLPYSNAPYPRHFSSQQPNNASTAAASSSSNPRRIYTNSDDLLQLLRGSSSGAPDTAAATGDPPPPTGDSLYSLGDLLFGSTARSAPPPPDDSESAAPVSFSAAYRSALRSLARDNDVAMGVGGDDRQDNVDNDDDDDGGERQREWRTSDDPASSYHWLFDMTRRAVPESVSTGRRVVIGARLAEERRQRGHDSRAPADASEDGDDAIPPGIIVHF